MQAQATVRSAFAVHDTASPLGGRVTIAVCINLPQLTFVQRPDRGESA